MDTTRRTFIKAGASLGLASITGAPLFADTPSYTYKLGTNVPVTHPIYLRLKEASEKIKAETGGKVEIRVFPNGQLGGDTEMLSQVRSGGIDLLTLPGVILANLVPMASLNSVGFAFPDYPTVWRAMDGSLGGFIRDKISASGLVVMDKVWDNGFREITANNAIKTPADLTNMKIRVPVSPLLLSLFKSLGAAPTPINFNELYSSLQTKVIDAQENPLPIIATAKLYEVQKTCAQTSHVWDGYWLLANGRSWQGLPQPMRDIVAKNLNAAATLQRADSEKLAVSLAQDLSAKGLKFNKPDPAPFRKTLASAGFYADWKSKFGAEAWSHLEAYSGKLG
ncbi:TRAP transporter substrate-binding protein [Burkholderia sp. Ax-1719]|uniref:TRAP transporter substrate-binding protein n=1 Tax=Burkholderia sp. Ax-1719 TaxID=2608334 RepID=UPI001422A081|nr:TRAP transporter substrate-binding protein [Burkholderia sp. Ax-1719]NIE66867.1 TRAP transporter substrate-binding protein [Burkholderia sp. Ax-1719]